MCYVKKEQNVHSPGSLIFILKTAIYQCGACNVPLFKSSQKFESGCGWPSFDDAIEGSIKNVLDKSLGMVRTEIVCNNCGGHIGHLFNDGPTETGQRYCVNSLSIDFKKD